MPTGWELVIILAVLLLLFGAKKLPDMARSVGQSARVFKGEMKGMKADDDARASASSDTPAPAPKAPPELPAGPPQAEPTPAADRSAQPRTSQPGPDDPPR